MRISSAIALASLVSAAPPYDTIVSIQSNSDDVDVSHLPRMLKDAGHTPDEEVASFLGTAEITTLKYVHSQVVQTSASTIDSDALCNFVAMASSKLSLQSKCSEDGDGEAFDRIDSRLHVDDPDAGFQVHLKWMKMGEVWRLALPHVTRKVKVAVLDSGINWADPDFAPLKGKLPRSSGGFLEGGWNFVTRSPIMTTVAAHGTKVCKVLAARGNNSVGMTGMAPNATLIPLQVMRDNGKVPLSAFLAGIDAAIDVRADILSISIGFHFNFMAQTSQDMMWAALRAAQDSGIVVVSSAGNKGRRASNKFPCWFGGPLGMCVAYLQSNKTHNVLNRNSNWGERVDVAAYGTRVYVGRKENGHPDYASGTSIATPIVSGLSTIVLSMGVEPRMVKPLILANVDPVAPSTTSKGKLKTIRGGAINALKTVEHAISWLSSKSRGLRGNDHLGIEQ
ncbi:hypothetical protein FOZ60_007471 [Perkinsus olseni]|uniref:subtilisin n=1 Tax=Perkinsus olseni TaxID=32597 RepID=A0A7J6PML9_PEROL|nr:hypothetical protein FOZ60_007471 [Perkinsus olseni]